MEISERAMISSLKPLIEEDEKSLWPVFALIKRETKRMKDATSEYAYITITSKARIMLYRFNENTSYPECYYLDSIMMGDIQRMQSGLYVGEFSFLVNGITKDIYFTVEPKPRGKDFPNQQRYAEKMFQFLEKLI